MTEPERILVVSTQLFTQLGYFQGFSPLLDRYRDLLDARNISFRPRPEMEKDPNFKQLIPYVIFLHRNEGQPTIFQYTRSKGQGEARLHGKKSIGIGGHISTVDVGGIAHPYHEGMQRELDEEVSINTPYTTRRVGLINDDSTEVGKVHLGIVHLFTVQRPDVQPREAEMLDCGFRPIAEQLADLEGFETWSQICLRALSAILPDYFGSDCLGGGPDW